MKIVHVGIMGEIDNYGQNTRDIYYKCIGEHSHADLYSSRFPHADIYLLHCFRNYKHIKAFRDFQRPHEKAKVISIIHSSEPCMPADCSDAIVTISQTWHDFMLKKYGMETTMIRNSLDWKMFDDVKINYAGRTFGKISRNELGKFHKNWNNIVDNVLKNNPDNWYCIISKDNVYLPNVNNATHFYNVKINDIEEKKKVLHSLNVYVDAHDEDGLCEETFCMALLEAMACGLPCIILGKGQPAMCEVLRDAGIITWTIEEFEKRLIELLNDTNTKEYYGKKAKERAKLFDNDKMIQEYNELFRKVLA